MSLPRIEQSMGGVLQKSNRNQSLSIGEVCYNNQKAIAVVVVVVAVVAAGVVCYSNRRSVAVVVAVAVAVAVVVVAAVAAVTTKERLLLMT